MSLLAQNTQDLVEKQLRVDFFYTYRRPPTKEERSRISDLVDDIFQFGQAV